LVELNGSGQSHPVATELKDPQTQTDLCQTKEERIFQLPYWFDFDDAGI